MEIYPWDHPFPPWWLILHHLNPLNIHFMDWSKLALSHMLHVWCIYLQNWVIYEVNVGNIYIYIPYMEHMGMVG